VQSIFIGDVQGCADELDELLERARSRFGDAFEAWWVGDLVNRGPDNLRVLRRVRAEVEAGRGRIVLGNHDLALIRTALGLRAPTPWDSIGDVLADPECGAWVDWLRGQPLVQTGRLGQQRFALVHAAVHPDWSLDELVQRARGAEARLGAREPGALRDFLSVDPRDDPDAGAMARLTRCRSVAPGGLWSAAEPALGSEAWYAAWSRRRHDYGVIYGHWSLRGLHAAPWLRGLDTGCVHHGRGREGALTAWLPDPGDPTPFDVPDAHFWQVPARRAYYAHRDEV
jgi:bis(5'-nucleosyl)-tetraphosphatase (symmetrical)